MAADNEVKMMMSVYPGTMTGFAALNAGLVSLNNVFGNAMRAFELQFDLLDTAIMTTGVVVSQLGIDAMNAFGEFEQGMKIVQMVSGQTAEDIGYLSQKANEFSVQYRTDIDQITEGLQTLGRAGLNSAYEQTEVLQNGLNTAKLEGRDLNSVLEELIQNTALLGGNLKSSDFGEQSEYVNDLLVATSMSAPITTHDVSETLKYSGGIAAAAGANIESESGKAILEDYMGAIAAFAQKGVTGSIAGTALRAFFNKPATQDSSVKEALASIKLKPEYLWEDDEEVMKPVSEQIKLIQDQMDDLNVSTMDRLQIWSKIVGGKMGQQMMKLDSSDIKELTKDIRSADDASNLAANSMKTYQANVKALGESGAALQRDVGEKLVFFVNPILEFMNKFTGLLDNNFGATVLAGSIIAFVGILGKKIIDVIRVVKGEISTLLSGAKYHLGKRAGMAIGPDGKLVPEDQIKGSKSKEITSAKDFSREYFGLNKANELKEMREKGYSDARIAMIGHYSNLSKDSTGTGMSDADFVKKIYPQLTSAQEKRFLELTRAAGTSSRNPFNEMFMDGKKLKDEFKHLTQEVEKTQNSMKTYRPRIIGRDEASVTLGSKTNPNVLLQKQKEVQVELQATQAAQAHVTALGYEVTMQKEIEEDIGISAAEAARIVREKAKEVVSDFNSMMRAIYFSVHQGKNSSVNYGPMPSHVVVPESLLRGEPTVPSTSSTTPSTPTIPITNMLDLSKVIRLQNIESADAQYRAAVAAHFDRLYNQPSPIIDEKSDVEKRIDRAIADKNYQKNIKDPSYDDARARYYQQQAADKYFRNQVFPQYGGYQGRLPSQEAIDASIKANKEAEIKATQQSAAEKQKEANLLKAQIATKQAEIDQAEKIVIAEQQNAAAIDRMTASARTFVAVMEGNWPSKAPNGIWSPGLNEKQKNDLKEIHDISDKRSQIAGYNRMHTTTPDQVYKSNLSYEQWYKMQQKESEKTQQDALRKMNRQAQGEALRESTSKGNKGIADSYRAYYMNTFGQEGEIREKQMQEVLNSQSARGTQYGNAPSPGFFQRFRKSLPSLPSIRDSGFYQNFVTAMNAPRDGKLLNFGTSALGKLGNKALNVADQFGGPLMIATIAVTTAIQMWQKAFQDYCEDLKEAGDKLKDAYSEWESAESSLRKTYQDNNPDATSDEIDQMIYDTYATMEDDMANAVNNGAEHWLSKLNYKTETGPEYEYDEESDDGTVKEKEEEVSSEEEYQKALQENTGALYAATAELNKALDNYVRKATDSWWGQDGWTGWLTDQFGGFADKFMKEGLGSSFSDNQEFLLTQSQADENYAGYTEMAGLMLEDFKDAGGNWIAGMRTMMGKDVEDLAHLFSPGTSTFNYLKGMAQFSAGMGPGGLSAQKNAKIQASMKNDSKTWKKLGKELSKRDSAKKSGKNIEKQTSRINGLIRQLNRTMGSNFSKTQILQAAYLQQLQEMYQVAQQAIVPIMQTNMQTAMSTLSVAGQVDSNTGTTVNTTDGTYQNAAIIAGLVAIIARSKAKDIYFDTAVGGSTTPGNITDVTGDGKGDEADVYWINKAREDGMNAEKFYAEYSKQYDEAAMSRKNLGGFGGLNPIWEWGDKGLFKNNDVIQEGALGYLRLYHATSKMEGYDYDPEPAAEASRKFADYVRDNGISLNDAIKTAEKNYTMSDTFKQKIVDAYNATGDDEGDGSGGGGGGSGSGSGDKDKNTGTRRERVDLVLCNKKEIPKLNVNLFKKPPSFTILNKNFKLRDVKINSEDKPKAIMAAIKNSFIDIQKRTDPKIIQDEDAVYDPKAATDGTNVPSGSAKTKTDNNSS